MKILVTGGAGYIGSHASHRLVELGHQVSVIDNFYSGFKWAVPAEVKLFEGDVGDAALVMKVIKEQGTEAILHFAAHIEVPESVKNPLKYYRNNTASAESLIETSFGLGVKKFVFSSTAAVYGDALGASALISEETQVEPINPYGHSKAMTERILKDLSAASDFRCVALRYFNVAGGRRDGKTGQSTPNATHLIKVAAQTAIGLRPKMFIFGTDYNTPDGTGVRDYIHIEDLVEAHVLALGYLERGGNSDVFNCGYGHGFSVREVIQEMKKVSGVDFAAEEGPRRPGDGSQLISDSSKIRRVLGWQPKFDDLSLICATALDWEKKLAKIAK